MLSNDGPAGGLKLAPFYNFVFGVSKYFMNSNFGLLRLMIKLKVTQLESRTVFYLYTL